MGRFSLGGKLEVDFERVRSNDHPDYLHNRDHAQTLLLRAKTQPLLKGIRLKIASSDHLSHSLLNLSFAVTQAALSSMKNIEKFKPNKPLIFQISLHQSHGNFKKESHGGIISVINAANGFWGKGNKDARGQIQSSVDGEVGILDVWAM